MSLPDPKDWYAIAKRLVGFSGFRDAPNGYDGDEELSPADHVSEYDLITNKVRGSSDKYLVVLDIDLPVVLVPSSNPGHSHLYIDKELTQDQSDELLKALAKVGIIEEGYALASDRRGMTRARTPWNLKPGSSIFNSTEALAERDSFHDQVEGLDFPDEGVIDRDLEPSSELLKALSEAPLEPVVVEEEPKKVRPQGWNTPNPFRPQGI